MSRSSSDSLQNHQDMKQRYHDSFGETNPVSDAYELEEQSTEDTLSQRTSKAARKFNLTQLVIAVSLTAFIAATLAITFMRSSGWISPGTPTTNSSSAAPDAVPQAKSRTKPSHKIIASVFYGRRRNIDHILDCYLKRNLVSNGGYLDEVHWIVETKDQKDKKFLDELLTTEPLYKSIDTHHDHWDWTKAWKSMSDPDAIYIKVDDDVLFIGDDAIPEMVHTLIDRPDALAVGANAVNEPDTFFLGYHAGAILPFLPEPAKAPTHSNATENSWRPSELPQYPIKVDALHRYHLQEVPPGNTRHRWLPLPRTYKALHKTPADAIPYCNSDCDQRLYHEWSGAAQAHMSLLSHLESGPDSLKVYHFGDPNGIWDTQLDRYRINCLAIWGRDVAKASLSGADDEAQLSMHSPRRLGRPFLVQTRAVVAHFAFSGQNKALEMTDVRDRYRGYAQEMICDAGLR